MLEDTVNLMGKLLEESVKERARLADALNNVADALEGLKAQERDMNPSEMLEKLVQERVNLGVSNSLENDFTDFTVKKIAIPSKLELAKEWLKEHPEHMKLTSRELSSNCKPHGVLISHAYWSKAKNEV